ncbi:MAG: NAD-dependent epimerase/dehydratase family protein [Myxococcales bacterium]|nr:NAD-dependent epimerase/dehydratase family protein [Myxococcales bacterium]
MKTVLITGARGTVGSYAVGLAEAAGYRIIASDITASGVRVPLRGEVRAADLRDARAVRDLVRGVDYVLHAAAKLGRSNDDPAGLSRVNTDAVITLYDAATDAGVERFVHTSTATLYATRTGPIVESDPLSPFGPYNLSKRAAEAFLLGHTGGDGPAWTILRAAPLYGQRGRHFAASLLAIGPLLRLATPVLPRPSGGPLGTMVHAEDVARALLFVLERDETVGEIYNVSDGDVRALGDRIGVTFDAYGLRSLPPTRLPDATYRGAGRFFGGASAYHSADLAAVAAWRLVVMRHRLRPALRPKLDREVMRLLYEDLVVDASKLAALGFKPRFWDFATGWREVLRWYQAERWVPRYT